MSRETSDNPHDKADAILDFWGYNYQLIDEGLFPGTTEEGNDRTVERVDTSGHNDPTCAMAQRRSRLLEIDAAVTSVIPERLRQRLYEQYVYRMTQDAAAARHSMSESAWRQERNEARLIFWNLYHDRRRLARTPIPGSPDERDATWSRRLKSRLQELGISRHAFARRVGVSTSLVGKWLTDPDAKLEWRHLYAICAVLQCSEHWLLYGRSDTTSGTSGRGQPQDAGEKG